MGRCNLRLIFLVISVSLEFQPDLLLSISRCFKQVSLNHFIYQSLWYFIFLVDHVDYDRHSQPHNSPAVKHSPVHYVFRSLKLCWNQFGYYWYSVLTFWERRGLQRYSQRLEQTGPGSSKPLLDLNCKTKLQNKTKPNPRQIIQSKVNLQLCAMTSQSAIIMVVKCDIPSPQVATGAKMYVRRAGLDN